MRLVVATGNAGKLAEILWRRADAEFDRGHGLHSIPAALGERGALADDSGLIVDALDGRPGLISAHYAGVHGDAARNIARVLAELRDVPEQQRSARFYSVVVLLRHEHDPQPVIGEGIVEGRILDAPIGSNGFGYQPIFGLPELAASAAEIASEHWHRISHRARALAALRARWPFG